MKLIALAQSNNIPHMNKPEDTRGKLVMSPAYCQHQPYIVLVSGIKLHVA
jgi:hypothetical protein